jgi:hypothetical protein
MIYFDPEIQVFFSELIMLVFDISSWKDFEILI